MKRKDQTNSGDYEAAEEYLDEALAEYTLRAAFTREAAIRVLADQMREARQEYINYCAEEAIVRDDGEERM